jgi:hypothetical protein
MTAQDDYFPLGAVVAPWSVAREIDINNDAKYDVDFHQFSMPSKDLGDLGFPMLNLSSKEMPDWREIRGTDLFMITYSPVAVLFDWREARRRRIIRYAFYAGLGRGDRCPGLEGKTSFPLC